MKYWDTSALLRAWKEGWIPASGMTRSHTVAEWFAIQTGPGLVFETETGELEKRALAPMAAAREAKRLFSHLKFEDLSATEVLQAIESAAQIANIKGGAIHDFLHARAAEVKRAKSIVTLNFKDFSRMTKLPLEHPSPGK
jgi:hypothetical protein